MSRLQLARELSRGDVLNPYESPRLLAEYLLFHYGSEEQILGKRPGPREALDFPVRCVHELVDGGRVPAAARALDVGCAVGRSSFELCAFCPRVLGIDFSHSFIQAARELKEKGECSFDMAIEGEICELAQARVPAALNRGRAHFQVGDATNLPEDLGTFDVILAANLICRLAKPALFLQRLPKLVNRGGQLLMTTPFTWLADFTAPSDWLGGRKGDGVRSFDALNDILGRDFEFQVSKDLPFLIREHERKFQYGIALGGRWVRR